MKDIIVETPYPVYTISLIGDHHFVIAGGGGQARCGVPNLMEFYAFDISDHSNGNSSPNLKAVKVHVEDTELLPTMNMDVASLVRMMGNDAANETPVSSDRENPKDEKASDKTVSLADHRFVIAAGQDRFCKLYTLNYDIACLCNGNIVPFDATLKAQVQNNKAASSDQVRRRGHSSTDEERTPDVQNGAGYDKRLGFFVGGRESLQTDSHPKNPFQKVVRMTPDGSRLITGGADGHFRIWDTKSMKKLVDHNAHKDDVDDISVSPDGKHFVTIGRDKKAFVWKVNGGAKLTDIPNPPPDVPDKYLFRSVRFSKLGRHGYLFYTVSIPVIKQAKGIQCFVCQWILQDKGIQHIKTVLTGSEVISAMAISNCGRFLGLGSMSGSVSVWDALELVPILTRKEIHDIFVTGLTFLPPDPAPGTKLSVFMAERDVGVLSIAADNTVQVHSVEVRSARPLTWRLVTLSAWLLVASLVLNAVEF